jgi:hypothetical protein
VILRRFFQLLRYDTPNRTTLGGRNRLRWVERIMASWLW